MDILKAPFSVRYEYLKKNIHTIDLKNYVISSPKDKNEYIIHLICNCNNRKPIRKTISQIYDVCIRLKLNLVNCMDDFDFVLNYLIKNFDIRNTFKNDYSELLHLKNKNLIMIEIEKHTNYNYQILLKILKSENNNDILFDIIQKMDCFYYNLSPNYIYDSLKKLKKMDENKLKSMRLTPPDIKNNFATSLLIFEENIFFNLYEMFEINIDEQTIQFLHRSGIKIPFKYLHYLRIEEPLSDIPVDMKKAYGKNISDFKNTYLNKNLKSCDILCYLNDTTKFIFNKMNQHKMRDYDFKPPNIDINPDIEKLKNVDFLKYIENNNLQVKSYFIADKNLSDILNVHQSCMIEISKVLDYLK